MLCLTLFRTDVQVWISLFILGSKFGVSQLFNLAYIGNAYLFPLPLVATSFAVCNVISRVISILAPYVAEIDPVQISEWVFIALMLLCMATSSFLDETEARMRQEQGGKG